MYAQSCKYTYIKSYKAKMNNVIIGKSHGGHLGFMQLHVVKAGVCSKKYHKDYYKESLCQTA